MKHRLLDLFSGAGGAGMGYYSAGFEVVGVDIEPHADYPFELVVADAMEVAADTSFLAGFEVVHSSPPCPGYSTITPQPDRHPRLIEPLRQLLRAWGGVYVIENVEGAKRFMDHPVRLCGSSFGLEVQRHRLFESNAWVTPLQCSHRGSPIGVYGDHPDRVPYTRPTGTSRGVKATSLVEASRAMGIDWMTWDDLTDAIPPTYTEYIGGQLLDHLAVAA